MGSALEAAQARYGGAPAVAPKTALQAAREKYATPKTSALESGGRGLLQELTFGFADEIAGGLESALTDKTYQQARDESRANYARAEEDNPIAYGAGQAVGVLGSLALPGGAVARTASAGTKLAKAIQVGKGLAKAAGSGAVYGAGKSEAKTAEGVIGDAATGGVIGAGAHGLVGLSTAALQKIAAAKGPIAEIAKRILISRATSVAGGALAGAVGGGGITSGLIGAGVGAAVPALAKKVFGRGAAREAGEAAERAVASKPPPWLTRYGAPPQPPRIIGPEPQMRPAQPARPGHVSPATPDEVVLPRGPAGPKPPAEAYVDPDIMADGPKTGNIRAGKPPPETAPMESDDLRFVPLPEWKRPAVQAPDVPAMPARWGRVQAQAQPGFGDLPPPAQAAAKNLADAADKGGNRGATTSLIKRALEAGVPERAIRAIVANPQGFLSNTKEK